jgi:hypothetical protein
VKTRASFGIAHGLAAAAAAVVAFALVGVAGAQQERLAIRGTSVTLTPPPGFTPARSARGLENTATGSTITISETSAQSYAELAEQFTSPKSLTEGYAQQKITIRSVRRIDGTIPFAIGQQAASGKTLTKYLGLLRGDKTVLVMFTIADRSFTETDAEAVLRSVEIAPEPTLEERLESIPFTFRAVEPYAVADIIPRQAVTLEVEGDNAQPVVQHERLPGSADRRRGPHGVRGRHRVRRHRCRRRAYGRAVPAHRSRRRLFAAAGAWRDERRARRRGAHCRDCELGATPLGPPRLNLEGSSDCPA